MHLHIACLGMLTLLVECSVTPVVQPAPESCHLLAESACKAVMASLDSSNIDRTGSNDALVQQQASLKALLQQSVMVLGIPPEDLFEGLVQRLEGTIGAKYEQKLHAATKVATLAQASPPEHACLQPHNLLCLKHSLLVPEHQVTCT